MIPTMNITMELPDQLVKSDALHVKYLKESLKEVAYLHWKQRIKKHFDQSARTKYHYAKRANSTIAKKLKLTGQNIDLVFTGRSKQKMLSEHKITAGGGGRAGEGDARRAVVVKLMISFAFKGGSGRFRKAESRQATTVAQMRKEVATITSDEVKQIAAEAKRLYVQKVNATKKSQRVGQFFNVGAEGSYQ